MIARNRNRTGRKPASRSWAGRLRSQEGFTIIEVLVATLILTVGLLTAFLMLTISIHASRDVRARQGAVTLARQITEEARSIPFSQISGSTIVSALQAMPGLASTSSGSSWTIARNGVTYTVTASATPVYDSKDPANASSNTTVDLQQVAASVSWTTFQGKAHQVTETTTVSRAGQDPGLLSSGLQLASASPVSSYIGTSTAPVINSSGTTSLTFSVTAPSGTNTIVWSVNGVKQTSWTSSASGNTWTSSAWSISGVSDGTYTIGAQAEDASGVDGPAVTIQVRLIRNVPSAPTVTGYGFNPGLIVTGTPQTAAELQWAPNPELNVVGYRVYAPPNSASATTNWICQTSTTNFSSNCGKNAWCATPTACVDLSPPPTTNSDLTYTVRALYYDANNVLQQGNPQSVTLASGTPVPPPVVNSVTLTAVTQPDNTAIITWTPVSGGTPVSFYRIYRGGDSYTNRYDTVPASSCTSTTCTYHDTNRSSAESYYVSAVGGTTLGADMAESAPTGPVSG